VTDSRLRELERRFRSTGAVVDEAARLAERARVGELPVAALDLAAYLGSVAARLALAGDVALAPESEAEWLIGLHDRDPVLWVRALIAAAGLVLTRFRQARPGELAPLHALEAAEAWCIRPCLEHAVAVLGGRGLSSFATADYGGADAALTQAGWALEHAAAAAWLVEQGRSPSPRYGPMNVLTSLEFNGINPSELRQAVAQELIPFVLGESDALRARVESREA